MAQGRRNARAPLFLVVIALVSIGRTRAQLGANVQRFPPFRRFTPPPKDTASRSCVMLARARQNAVPRHRRAVLEEPVHHHVPGENVGL